MIRTFNKGEKIHCLLTSYNKPNLFLPVSATVKDTQWDPVNPRYLVKITKFYDSVTFLKKHIFQMNFFYDFDDRSRKFKIKENQIVKIKDLEAILNSTEESKYYVVVDAVMCKKTKKDLQKLYDQVHFFLVNKNLSEIKDNLTRGFYQGPLSLDSREDFNRRFRLFIGESLTRTDIDIEKYLRSL